MINNLSPMNAVPAQQQVAQVILKLTDGTELLVADDGQFFPGFIPCLYSLGQDAQGKHMVALVIGPLKVAMPAMMAATELVEVEQPLIIDKVN